MHKSDGGFTFGEKFIGNFYRHYGRFPTDWEIDFYERGFIEFLKLNNMPVPINKVSVNRRHNQLGEVIDQVIVGDEKSE